MATRVHAKRLEARGAIAMLHTGDFEDEPRTRKARFIAMGFFGLALVVATLVLATLKVYRFEPAVRPGTTIPAPLTGH